MVHRSPCLNFQWAGNPAQWVLWAGERVDLVKFAAADRPAGGSIPAIPAGSRAIIGQAGSASALPASITKKQALSFAQALPVERNPSNGLREMADFRRFCLPRRIIGHFQTARRDRRAWASSALLASAWQGGVAPLARWSPVPDLGCASQNPNLGKSAQHFVAKCAVPSAGGIGCRCNGIGHGPENLKSQTGSGVRGAARQRSLRESARFLRMAHARHHWGQLQRGVRVDRRAHCGLFPGRTRRLGKGRG